jgi:hypothetical protein
MSMQLGFNPAQSFAMSYAGESRRTVRADLSVASADCTT